MAKVTRNFIAGRMNKVVDQRLVPNGEYIDALNIRMGDTENSEIGVIENAKGNEQFTAIKYIDGTLLSNDAVCIGKIADSANETIYWFIHDPSFPTYLTGKLDLIVSFNTLSQTLLYHIVSVDDGGGENTTLNFNPQYLVNAVNKVDNLIFFSDNYNPPRFFNINRNYPVPIADVDQFTGQSILVVKQPPIEAPTVTTFLTGGQENYIEERFCCFAYRYKFADNEYSATSQFSQPAFTPKSFEFSVDSYLNEGMVNINNTVNIVFNTGNELVVGIDLLFKDAGGNIIKVIEKLNKAQLGYTDNVEKSYIFNNGKIYTTLPDYEILRLYDNVPLLAKAQTLMGNRLLYGNYIEGYDIIDVDEQPINIDYTTDLVTTVIGEKALADSSSTGNYNINGAHSVPDSILNIDFTGVVFPMPAGGSVSIDVTITHDSFTGGTPSEQSTNIEATFTFYLLNSYNSAYELATSSEFQNAVGTATNIETDLAFSCDGVTFTDLINCQIPNNLDALEKYRCGISADGQPIAIITTTPSSTTIGLQFTATRFVDYAPAPTANVYEYYKITFASATYSKIATPASLHSNRGYEIGIVYMDDYNRATTVLVSNENAIHVPCGNSDVQNAIQVTIPYLPPAWATRYKFVCKATQENYETIYCSIFFEDPDSNAAFLLLEGENAQKVENGDRLIVKKDTSGAVGNCAYATILEKEVRPAGFLEIPSQVDPNVNIPVPGGVYVKVNPTSFQVEQSDTSVVAYGTYNAKENYGSCPTVFYPVSLFNTATSQWENYTIPIGSKIRLFFKFERLGLDRPGDKCEKRIYTLDRTFVSTADYASFKEWWDYDDVASVLNTGVAEPASTAGVTYNTYNPVMGNGSTVQPCDFVYNYQFLQIGATQEILLAVGGIPSCTGKDKTDKRAEKVWVDITVFRADNLLVFETEPSETLPDVYFENNLSFAIENGNHQGNVQNQISTSTPAIVDTGFFNCYAFGNGVESYKIRDSITGRTFNLGNRVFSVSAQDYKQAHRFADITYSGIYNNESNVNKLNEFNLGLINYKKLENSFGPIQVLDGRQTDVLVLQEDRISYVLAGKNLLSDATGAGVVAVIPEVLGTQIARVEKYGNSANPESYVNWGYDRFFTDVKRGAVLNIKGSAYSNDQLIVVSEMLMRTYFRDVFIDDFNTQKLGAFDPYLNEYVLAMNDTNLPGDDNCDSCGVRQTFTLTSDTDKAYCINVGKTVGETTIAWTVSPSGVDFEVNATYNGSTTSSGTVSSDGSIIVNKNVPTVERIDIQIITTGDIGLEVTVQCVSATQITLVEVCLTNDSDSGKFVHNQYRFTSGSYISPTTSDQITFATGTNNPLVSRYNAIVGDMGYGSIPVVGSTVRLICNKFGFDDFDFDAADNYFRFLNSNTLYPNTQQGIQDLLDSANIATPNQGSGTNQYAEFTMGLSLYLYLIWDYRSAEAVELCFSEVQQDACCDCEPCDSECRQYFISNSSSGTFVDYRDCYTGEIESIEIAPYTGYFVCSDMDYVPVVTSGVAEIECIQGCGCDTCDGGCVTFDVEIFDTAEIHYTNCAGTPTVVILPEGEYEFTTSGAVPVMVSGVISINFSHCGS